MGNFNNIILHRNEVRDKILKSFNSEFDELEKGKWNVGDTKVYQGITWEVGGFNAKGAPLWRKAKGGAGGGAASSNNVSNDNKEKTIDKKQTDKNSTFAKNVVDKIKKVLKNTTISNDQLQKLENAISNDEENAKKILSIEFPKTKDVDLKSPESEAIKVVNLGDYEMICRTYKDYNFNYRQNGKSDPLVLENYSITLRNKVKDSKIIRHDSSWIPGFYDKEDNQQKCIIGALYSYYKHKENF